MKQNIIIIFSLLILETFISILISLLYYGVFNNNISNSQLIFNSINTPLLIGLWRLMFYLIPSIIITFLFFQIFKENNNAFLYSFLNIILFSLLTFIYKILNFIPFLNFNEILFWITIISISISPYILSLIPYYKNFFTRRK